VETVRGWVSLYYQPDDGNIENRNIRGIVKLRVRVCACVPFLYYFLLV